VLLSNGHSKKKGPGGENCIGFRDDGVYERRLKGVLQKGKVRSGRREKLGFPYDVLKQGLVGGADGKTWLGFTRAT